MRKFLSVLLTAIMVLSLVPFSVSADNDLGFTVKDGTAYIYTADELMALTEYCNLHSEYEPGMYEMYDVEIMADIDLTGKTWYPIDYNYNCEDRHTFDGNGHTISNMSIVVEDEYDYIAGEDLGFFSDIENADIMNLNVQGEIRINCDYVEENIGGFGGDVDNGTVITNCHANVDIIVDAIADDDFEIGGFIGDLNDASIYNCSSKSDITVEFDIDPDDTTPYTMEVGGFIGDLDDSEIAGCRSEGSVVVNYDGAVRAGGIAGESDDSFIYSSSSSVDVTVNYIENNSGTATIGGFIGESLNVYIVNSFSTSDLVGKDLTEVFGFNEIGGLVGEAEDADEEAAEEEIYDALVIENCYFDGTITVAAVDENLNIGGIVGDVESDVDLEIANVWSSCSEIGIDTDNVNGEPLPEMSVLLAALNENAKELDERGIPYITIWALGNDGRPVVSSLESVVHNPTPESPMFKLTETNGVIPQFQWQVSDSESLPPDYVYFYDDSHDNSGIYKVTDSEGIYPLYFEFTVTSTSDVISFRWREKEAGSDNVKYQLHYALHSMEVVDPFIIDVAQGVLSGSSEWQTVTLTGIEPGAYYLDFVYPKNFEESEDYIPVSDDTTTNEVEVEITVEPNWSDIPGETDNVLVNENYTGKYVRCAAYYPDIFQTVTSHPFRYDYEAIDYNSIEGYEKEPTEESTPTMVPLFFGTTVRVYDAANGTITPNGIPMIIGGMEMTFKFIPDEGYEVADVLVNGESVGAVETLTLDGWQGYVKLSAVFEKIEP